MSQKYQGKTEAQWVSEIAGWQFEDIWPTIMARLYPDHLMEDNSTGKETGEALYDLIKPYQLVGQTRVYATKLSYDPTVLADITLYKSEQSHIIDLAFRFLNLFSWKDATENAGLFNTFNNRNLLLDHIIENDLEAELILIEAEDAILLAAHNAKKQIEANDLAFMSGLDPLNLSNAEVDGVHDVLIRDWLKRN